MSKYRVGQRVDVKIERVLPFGVFARLEDGARAYIRRRELHLDADIDPTQVAHPGQKINAVIIKLEEGQKHLELSYRATLDDPWKNYSGHHKEGEVIRGVVRAIHPSGIFVRAAAGVSGYIPLPELAPWEITKPEEIFWVGDEVEAVITHLDARNQRLNLSIRLRMLQHEEALEVYEYFAGKMIIEDSLMSTSARENYSKPVMGLPSKIIGKVLVVEDDYNMRTSLVDWLEQRGLKVDQAESHASAASKIQEEVYGVVFLDLNLKLDDGLDLIQHIQRTEQQPCICVMSSFYTILEREEELLTHKITQVFPKPLGMEEIEEFLLSLAKGEIKGANEPLNRFSTNELSKFGKSRELTNAQQPPQDRLRGSLIKATKMLRAELGLIFEKDPTSQVISIVAQSGEVTFNEPAMYQLGDSPVNDIIQEGISIFENQVTKRAIAKFDKLLNLVAFESCIGVPIPVQDEIRHAAFFFHSAPDAFRRPQFREAMIGAIHFTALLEQESLNSRLQSLNPIVLSGELTAGLAHEVSNKISSLELQVRNLLPLHSELDKIETELLQLLNVILDLKKTTEIFQQLMVAPDMKARYSINTIIERVTTLLKPVAHKEHTKVIVRLEHDIPLMDGNNVAIQQVILNIMLNAIQQIALKAKKHNWQGARILEVCTSLDKMNEKVVIRCRDMGPGVHKRLWEKIFTPGFSTRNGSGLGLYIARDFVTTLSGTIRVEESFVPLGTTFVVELPVMKHKGAPHE